MTDLTAEMNARLVEFLQLYYPDQLEALQVQDYSGVPTIEVSIRDLARYDNDLVDDLRQHPDTVLSWFERVIDSYEEAAEYALDHASEFGVDVERVNHPLPHNDESTDADRTELVLTDPTDDLYHEIGRPRGKVIGDLVAFEGMCKQRSDPKPRIVKAAFRCGRCGTPTDPIDLSHTFDLEAALPDQCQGCDRQGPFERISDGEDRREYQQLRIQEPPGEAINASNPREVRCDLLGEHLMDPISPGERVTVIGVLREDADSEGTLVDDRLTVKGVVPEEVQFEEVEFGEDDVEQIEELADSPALFDHIEASVAPSIYGHEDAKLAAALQLFGGVSRTVHGNRKRGEIHIMFIGDPGTGKSAILQSVRNIAPRAVSSSGTSSTQVGLTASAVKEKIGNEEQWTLEAGSLVLADGGLITIDELDNMREETQQSLDEALSEGTVTVDKANTHAQLNARCSALMAANPKHGRFDPYEPYSDQFDMPKELLNRCDLVCLFTDRPNEERDAAIADTILQNHATGSATAATDGGPIAVDETGVIPHDLFQKYVAYARRNHDPRLPDEVGERLKDWYMTVREALSDEEENKIAMNSRLFEGTIRLAQASARARLRDEVQLEDADRAIDLVMEVLGRMGFDVDRAGGGVSASQNKRRKEIIDTVRDLCSEYEDGAPDDKVIDQVASHLEIEERTVRGEVTSLLERGELYRPNKDHLAPT